MIGRNSTTRRVRLCVNALILTAAVAMTGSVACLAGSMSAELDKTKTSLDEPFWLTVTISGSLDGEVAIPESKDFEFVRSGESTNISIINGAITKERQLTYQVRPLREGRLRVPPLAATIDGKTLTTAAIDVDVAGGTPLPEEKSSGGNSDKLIFVEREIPKDTLYEGEAIVSKVRLLTRARLTGATPSRQASPEWRLIGVDGQKNLEVVRDGVRWNVIELAEGLVPLKSGSIKVPAYGINATWIKPLERRKVPRSVFDMFQHGMFQNGEEVSKTLLSEQRPVTVRPLPSPRPANFADIVGAFTITGDVSKRDLNAGDTTTVTVEIKGQGSLDRGKDIKLNVAGAKVYDDRPVLTEKVEPGAGLVSKKIIKFAVVPHAAGNLDLGAIALTAFNPYTEAYEELKVSLGNLKITGGTASGTSVQVQPSPAVSAPASPEPAAGGEPNQAPRPAASQHDVKAVESVSGPKSGFFKGTLALALVLAAGIAVFAVWLLRASWTRVRPKVDSHGEFASELARLKAHSGSYDDKSIAAAVDFFRKVLAGGGRDGKSMTGDDLLNAARDRGFSAGELDALTRVIAALDRARYADDLSLINESVTADLQTCLRKIGESLV
jgi:hypothetical protein